MDSKDIYMINCMKYGFETFKDLNTARIIM